LCRLENGFSHPRTDTRGAADNTEFYMKWDWLPLFEIELRMKKRSPCWSYHIAPPPPITPQFMFD